MRESSSLLRTYSGTYPPIPVITALIFPIYLLFSKFLNNSYLSTIVTTSGAYCVIYIVSAAVGANCQCRSYCLIMSSSLKCTSL